MTTLDLEALRERHPLVPEEHAADLALHASVAFAAAHHAPGVDLRTEVADAPHTVTLTWRARLPTDSLDANRVTELGAEAVALALAHEIRGWTVRRRMQKFEHADWLVADAQGERFAFEVSGTVNDSLTARVNEKLQQVSKCHEPQRAVCVVRFIEPRARLTDWDDDQGG